jgi:hypothetical protein
MLSQCPLFAAVRQTRWFAAVQLGAAASGGAASGIPLPPSRIAGVATTSQAVPPELDSRTDQTPPGLMLPEPL